MFQCSADKKTPKFYPNCNCKDTCKGYSLENAHQTVCKKRCCKLVSTQFYLKRGVKKKKYIENNHSSM